MERAFTKMCVCKFSWQDKIDPKIKLNFQFAFYVYVFCFGFSFLSIKLWFQLKYEKKKLLFRLNFGHNC